MSRSWSAGQEADLLHNLALCVGKQTIDIEKLGMLMRGKDHYGNDQLSKQQVSASLRVAAISLDRPILARWMKAADIVENGIYSIPALLDILEKANADPNRDKYSRPGIFLRNETVQDADSKWKSILDLNSSLPRQTGPPADRQMRQKNVGRLKGAMYQSYNQYQGYLPPKDMVQLALAYSTVYHLGMDQGGIREAVEWALDKEKNMGMASIERFIEAILDCIM